MESGKWRPVTCFMVNETFSSLEDEEREVCMICGKTGADHKGQQYLICLQALWNWGISVTTRDISAGHVN